MADDDAGGLHDFVAGRYADLRRSAFLMCGDWALADDRTRRSLARLVAENRRTAVDDPTAFVYAHLVASLQRLRPRTRRRPFSAVPDAEAPQGRTAAVLAALHTLAPRCRAVLVLRHWDGFAVDETADMLGLADERVDVYEAAALAALDFLLAEKEPVG